ncbi:ORF V: Enzymatic polyprotein [Labeo rohita]|uniref:ribonuclease H n=1 Tax=Labeo rohita TaxID=84645 RepID=A0ABQ8N0H0_LABRO|nr:ORF V: Enzymatic polyprotein [Labeo rohita]
MRTLPVFQDAVVSSEPIPQSLPPSNAAELGSSPPLWGSLGQLVRSVPAGVPLQGTELVVHTNPEASLERLVPLVDYLAAWKLLPNVSAWVLRTVERGYRIQFGAPPPPFNGVFPTVVSPEQCLVMDQEVETLLRMRPSRWSFLKTGSPGSTAALSPRTFTKCVDAALAPLRLRGIRILNYIDDWLILAQSEHMAVQHHMKELGLRLNAKKSVLSPLQRTTYLGVVWDHDAGTFVTCSNRVDPHCSHESERRPVTHCKAVPTTAGSDSSCFQHDTFWPAVHQTPTVVAQDQGVRALDMWKKPWSLSQGPVLGVPCRRVMLVTDASLTGWGVVMSGVWSGRHLTWHINCLEMLPVFRALKHFLPDLIGRHVLVRTDNTAVVYYINHQGGLRSRTLYKLAHQILVWSQDKLLSLRAVHVPGHLNMGADILSKQWLRPGEWMLHPEVVKQIWRVLGQAQVDLRRVRNVPSGTAPLGLDAMVQTWPRLRLYAFPMIALLPGVLERVRWDGVRLLLVAPYWPARAWFSDLISLLDGSPWEIVEVVETILQSRAPSMRKLYALKWKLFTSWCGHHQQDPVNCPVGTVLEFLQDRFSTGLAHSTLRVYVAAISAYHAPLGGICHALRLRPPVRHRVPTWDLAVVLEALCRPPFEPIEESSDHHLSIKTVLLLALTSLKRVKDLQALSVAPSHLEFAPGMAKAFLYPRPGYVPKVPSSAPRPIFEHWTHTSTELPCGEKLTICLSAYEFSDLPSPLGVKAHSTRGISASKAFMSGVPMQDICDAAEWSTPSTFVRFYDLDLRVAPGSSVLRPSTH